ncbi:chitobiase/beta-hexosaminidase C-terminal domain-containing protein [Pyxidicoccus parkwayensis]|uniref:Chitobiase/beta-hexosaminidase C-terminal domain-containing protein n=1 Tax=Pyxidicoccus parkwayensis TaxID=2813578 RepID=A0ABX7P3S0_9BACT|nr:chitobiase/beta-hexosaminidase C-terminal domain-containing protein [Pyxidicoccus parkwaysis]QSQ25097.1 chitobiase/beta-hexosaminidase C-terminal domain-containing protein [Pyxidicoccus parkwaysis]
MPLKTSWPLRCAVTLLLAQLASACGGGDSNPDPNPNPNPAQDTAAPTSKATPPGGSFTRGVAVALVCEDGAGSGCAATYYTLDGSTPSKSSTQYREPFTLSATTTLRFFSVDKAGNTEAVKTEQYTFSDTHSDTQAPTTTATPAGGFFNSARAVTLACDDGSGGGCAATHYTVDGSVPTESSPRYTAPVAVAASTTLRFFSVDQAGNVEGARTERYVIDAEPPTVAASPRGGTSGAPRVVTLTCDDGTGSGCAAIHYTTDGTIPTESSPTYTAPLTLETTTRLRFVALDKAGNASTEGSELYTLDGTGPVSTATPKGGTYRAAIAVLLDCNDNGGSGCATTYYTTTGVEPTRASARYTNPISLSGNTTLRFFSVDAVGNDGPVVTETYVFDTVAPTVSASPKGGAYFKAQTVTLTCNDTGSGCSAIHYTLNGATPDASSPRYTGPLTVSTNTTLSFLAVDVAGNSSGVVKETYTFSSDTTAPVTSVDPQGGLYGSARTVTLSCLDNVGGDGCDGTFYTLDGSEPTTASTRNTGPITISTTAQLRFRSVDRAGNLEATQSAQYTIDTLAPVTQASPAGGTFEGPITVTLSCTDTGGATCAETRYTTDGTAPEPGSPLYTGPLTLIRTTTLRFFSVDSVGNVETVRQAVYTLPTSTSTASQQIADVRAAPAGATNMPINGAVITYIKPGVGNLANDPAGFFLQAERAGPAVFVEVDPATLSPPPQVAQRVDVTVSNKRTVNNMVRVNISSFAVQGTSVPLSTLSQEVSSVDLPSVASELEAELISLTGQVNGTLGAAGAGHVQAPLVTVGVPEGSASANAFRLRIVETVQDQLDVTHGCTVGLLSPLWVFATTTQPSVWSPEQVTSLTCPGPRVASALARGSGTVSVRFDRKLSASSLQSDGQQFSIPGLTVTGATLVGPREVWLSTSPQTPRQQYTVTVASTVQDTIGTALQTAGNSGTFKGYQVPPTLRITEIAPAVGPNNINFGRDLVELYVVQGGNTLGMTLEESTLPSPLLATLPDVDVATGDIIVIHLNPDRDTAGFDAPGSELTSKSFWSQSQYASNYDNAWDFHGGSNGVSGSNRVFRIRDALGNTQDAVPVWLTLGSPPAAFPPQLQAIQSEGQWLPSSCGGALCTYNTFPSALDVSVNWGAAFPSGGRTTTLGRIRFSDTDTKDDWAVGSGTLGFFSP